MRMKEYSLGLGARRQFGSALSADQWSAAFSLVLRAGIVIWSFGRPYCAGGPGASLCSSQSDEARGRTVQYHCDPSYLAIGQWHRPSFGSYLAAAWGMRGDQVLTTVSMERCSSVLVEWRWLQLLSGPWWPWLRMARAPQSWSWSRVI